MDKCCFKMDLWHSGEFLCPALGRAYPWQTGLVKSHAASYEKALAILPVAA